MQTNTQHNTKTRQDNTSNIDHDTRHEHRLTQMLNTKLTSTIQIQTNAKYDGGHGASAIGRCGGRPIPLRGVALWNVFDLHLHYRSGVHVFLAIGKTLMTHPRAHTHKNTQHVRFCTGTTYTMITTIRRTRTHSHSLRRKGRDMFFSVP